MDPFSLAIWYDSRSSLDLNIIMGILFVVAAVIPGLLFISYRNKRLHSMRHQSDYEPSREDTFEDKLRKAKMQPKRILTFGQNYLACDDVKKKVLVQSMKVPEGVLLAFGDVVSYEIVKDGQTIRRGGAGQSFRADVGGMSVLSAKDGVPLYSDLQLIIKTRNAAYPEVIMPYILFSIDSEFALNEALEAATEAAEELERII